MGNRFSVVESDDNEGNTCYFIRDNVLGYNLDEIYYNEDWAIEDAILKEGESYG